MRRIEGAAGSPAPRNPLHEGRDPFFSTLLEAAKARCGSSGRLAMEVAPALLADTRENLVTATPDTSLVSA